MRLVGTVGVVAALMMGVLFVLRAGPPTPGPLQPTDNVNAFGFYATDGDTVSFVVQYRGERPATATLRSLTLHRPDPGLEVIAAGVLIAGFPGYYVSPSFPPGEMAPIDGFVLNASPHRSSDVFFALGVRVQPGDAPLSARGIWLEYEVDGTMHRALLPWLFTVCHENGGDAPCVGLEPAEFEFPVAR